MNIRCPNCQTVFRVDASRIPAAGVRARCARCAATFHVSRDGQATIAAAAAQAPPPQPKPAGVQTPPAATATPTPRAGAGGSDGTAMRQGQPGAGQRAVGTGSSSHPGAPVRPSAPDAVRPQGTRGPGSATSPTIPPRSAAASDASQPTQPQSQGARPPVSPSRPRSPSASPAPAPPRGSAASSATASRPGVFGTRDPKARAQRIARALVSDIVAYHPDRRDACLQAGTLRTEFRDEIMKSWEEYTAQVGEEMATSTPYFRNALNEILARGQAIF